MRLIAVLGALAVLTAACATNDAATNDVADLEGIQFPQRLEPAGFNEIVADVGAAYVAGQPDEAALERLAAEGVTTVISLRTPAEMDNRSIVPFDEPAKAAALGMSYVNIPLGGEEHPYTPAAVDAFAQAFESAEGKVLLHCTVAWRASHMWAAYLVKHRGMEVEEAIRHAEAINFGSRPPIEQLLELELVYNAEAVAN